MPVQVCACIQRRETKSCDNSLDGERTWEGFILLRSGWSPSEGVWKEQLIVSISSKSVLAVKYLIKCYHPSWRETSGKSGGRLSDGVKTRLGDREKCGHTEMIPVPPAQEAAEFLCSDNLQEEPGDLQMSTCSTLVCFSRQWLQQQ